MRFAIVSDAETIHSHSNGPARTFAEELPQDLRALGHEAMVLLPSDFSFRRSVPGYRQIEVPLTPSKTLTARLKDFAPDAIQTIEGYLSAWAIHTARAMDVPVASAYCTRLDKYAAQPFPHILQEPVRRLAERAHVAFHNASDMVMVATEELGREIAARGITTPRHVIGRGVDTSIFHPGPQTLFADLPRPVSLYVGRLSATKNIDALRDIPSLVIVGSGEQKYEEQLRERFSRPDVRFMGYQEGAALADCYRSADLFVFPSKTENYGRVIAEALACGLPFVAYDDAAARLFAREGEAFGVCAPLSGDLRAAFDRVRSAWQPGQADLSDARHAFIRRNHSTLRVAERLVAGMQTLTQTRKSFGQPE